MLPTPSTAHVDFDRVYEPAEDSYLLLNTLSSTAEVSFLKQRFSPGSQLANNDTLSPSPLVIEIGTGSGVVLAFLTAHAHALFGRSDILTLGVDINQYACKASIQTVEETCQGELHGGNSYSLLTSVNGDLASAIRPGTVDVLVFNPPYVPTLDVPHLPIVSTPTAANCTNEDTTMTLDADSDMLSLSYAGGADGMEVTNRLLQQLPAALNADRGIAYILLCKQNNPEEVAQRIRQWGAEWMVDVVGRSGKQGGWEKLSILRIRRGCRASEDSSLEREKLDS
ncbi:MAG: hypothetical protein Q9182_001998 [Xanthomendoza sp. 2 TL-2023]